MAMILSIIFTYLGLKCIWRIITFPIRLIGRLLSGGRRRRYRAYDVYETEDDEFDWWLDDRGI